MPELILPCGHKEYVCTTISVEMYRRYTEIMERNDSDSIRDAFEANTKILMVVFGARQREVEEADPEDVLSAVKEIHFMMQDVITKKFLDLNPEHPEKIQKKNLLSTNMTKKMDTTMKIRAKAVEDMQGKCGSDSEDLYQSYEKLISAVHGSGHHEPFRSCGIRD